MESSTDQHRCQPAQGLYISDVWRKAFSPAADKADTRHVVRRLPGKQLLLVAGLAGASLCLLLLLALTAYKAVHDYVYGNDLQQLHENNLFLINTLKPLSAKLDNIRLLAASNSNHRQSYTLVNTTSWQLLELAAKPGEQQLTGLPENALRQRLLNEFRRVGNSSVSLAQGYFEYQQREYLWAADAVPGTPYSLILSTSHQHSIPLSMLQNIRLATGLLFLLSLPAILARLLPRARPQAAASAQHRDRQLSDELRQAIAGDKLELYFQAKIQLEDNSITGVEALARWTHPRLGFIPPDTFIKIAEQNGLIRQFTQWTLQKAINQCAQWRQAGKNLKIAVNLSACNLSDTGLGAQISHWLQKNQLPASQLMLEISEHSMLEHPQQARSFIRNISQLGVVIVIDNVGASDTRACSLGQLPVSEIKIDRSLIANMQSESAISARVSRLIQSARQQGLGVIAEGVENQATLEQLQGMACPGVQGYYICRPLPCHDLLAYLEACQATNKDSVLNSAEYLWKPDTAVNVQA